MDSFIHLIILIIIMEICKAPTLRLKALNKHTHIMYIEMENGINFFFFFMYLVVTLSNVLTEFC